MSVMTFQHETSATWIAQSKSRSLQSIIYPKEKIFIGTGSILARGKSRVLPTDPLFTLKIAHAHKRD